MIKNICLICSIVVFYVCTVSFQPPHISFPFEYTKTITNTEGFNPSSSTVLFNVEIANLNECTYEASKNEDFVFRAKVKVISSDGTSLCELNEPLSHLDANRAIQFFSTAVNRGQELRTSIELVAFPRESPSCFGPPLSCNRSMPVCCFDFDCCDCGQWDGELLEGFWISDRITFVVSSNPTLNSVVARFNMAIAYPPHQPIPNYASDPFSEGCVCCGH